MTVVLSVEQLRAMLGSKRDPTLPQQVRPAAVVFDLDGTLIDTMGAVPAGYAAAVHAVGGPRVTAADVVTAWTKGSAAAALSHLLGRPARAADLEALHRHLITATEGLSVFPEARQLLQDLMTCRVLTGLYTGAARRLAEMHLDRTGLGSYFDAIVCGDEVTEPKPGPAGLRMVCDDLQVNPHDIVYVGDSDADRACAAAAGATFCFANWSLNR